MKNMSMPRGVASLVLRQGLALVLFGWGYDAYFNPAYYARLAGELTPNPALPTVLMALQLGLAGLLMTGVATRLAAATSAVLFAALLASQGGHQPIGLPQNVGLTAAAIALCLLGPGALALGRAPAAPSPLRTLWAGAALRLGLAITFLVYGIGKLTDIIEYRIVVAEIPALAPLVAAFGAERTVYIIGVLEILIALAIVVPHTVKLAALGQAGMLLGLLVSMGYPFSYPQDLGLVAAVGALALSGWGARQIAAAPAPERTAGRARAARRPVGAPQPAPAS